MPSTGKRTSAPTKKAPVNVKHKDMRDGSLAKAKKTETGKRTMIDGDNRNQKPGKKKISEDTPV